MPTQGGISYGLRLDLSSLGSDLNRAADLIEGSAEGVDYAVAPKFGGSAVHEVLDGLSDAVTGLSARAGSAFPVSQIGARMASLGPMFDRVAGTIITGFRRIDSEINFPKAQAALNRIASAMTTLSLVDTAKGSAKGWREVADKAIAMAKKRSESLWGDGPIQRYWKAFEERGRAARQAFKDFEAVPSARTGPGFGRRIPFSPKPTQQQAIDLANYERAVFTIAKINKAFLAARLGAKAFAAVAVGALGGVGDLARIAVSPITLMVAGYARASAAIARLKSAMGVFGDVAGKTFSSIFKLPLSVPFLAATSPARTFGATVRAAGASVNGLSASVKSFGTQALAALGVFGLAFKAVQFLRDGVKSASDLNETVSATKQVFGDSFGAVDAQAKSLERAFGVSRRAQLDAASAFGSIAQGAGYGQAESAKLGNTLTQLAADFGSFKNLSFDDAAGKLRAALAGETEPLRQYGVVIDDASVKAEALRLGLATSTKEIGSQAKVAARASLIQRALAAASGDLSRTQDGAANQFRKAGGGITAFGTQIGSVLLPAMTAIADATNEFLAVILDVFEANRPVIEQWGETLASWVGLAGKLIRNFGSYWTIAKISATQAIANMLAGLATVPENFGIITEYLGRNWFQLLQDLVTMTATALGNIGRNAANFGMALWDAIQGKGFNFEWTGLLDGFERASEKFPDLVKPAWVDMSADMQAEFAKIADREARRAKPTAGAGPAATQGLGPNAEADGKDKGKAGKDDGPKLAAAVEAGSREAYSAVAKALTGRDGTSEQTKIHRDNNGVLREIRDEIKKKPAGGNAAPAFGF